METPLESKPILPDFTRWQWAGLTEKNFYQCLFQDASRAFGELERLSVVEDIRRAALVFHSLNDLPMATAWAHAHGLMIIPVSTGVINGFYSASGNNGQSANAVRVVYTRPEHYKDILPFSDDDKIGQYLGFAPCCREAFAKTWGVGQVDSTWEEWNATDWSKPAHAHTLFRWMGLRLVPHMPCSWNCMNANHFAEQMYQLGVRRGYIEEMLFLKEVLSWPVVGSRLFGIAEYISPALKITTRTDWTPTLERASKPTTGVGYQKVNADWWKHNGFSGHCEMRSAHKWIITSLKELLTQNARIVDLGCGNGALLRRLKIYRPDVKIAGVDTNADAIASIPPLTGKFISGRIQDGAWFDANAYDAVLVNPVRLLEMAPEEAEQARAWLREIPQVFVYAYGDVTKQHGTLAKLTEKAGLGNVQMLAQTPSTQVGLLPRI